MSLTRRLLIIVLALVGAAGFAISVEGGRWWSLGGEIHVGPAGTQRCFGGECGVGDLTWVHGSGFWERCGSGAYAGGLVAGLALLALAGSIAARRAGRACPRCGRSIVREAFANRSSFRCPRCQPRPRVRP